MPKLAALTGDFAVARNVHAHAVVHSVCQTWVQIGRNPLAALGNIAPNIGSIVAAEKFPNANRPTSSPPSWRSTPPAASTRATFRASTRRSR
jgi:hypothetical protein